MAQPLGMTILQYLQENDPGTGISIADLAAALGKEEKSIRPAVTLSLVKKGFATYEKRDEGGEKPVAYAVMTEDGANFDVPAEDAE